MKFLISIVFVIALATAGYGYSASWGARYSSDILLYYEPVNRPYVKSNYWNVDVRFPRSGQVNNRTISAVHVYDRFANNSGAVPNLYSGGPGYRFAYLNLSSPRGINSTVEIWGRR